MLLLEGRMPGLIVSADNLNHGLGVRQVKLSTAALSLAIVGDCY